MNHTQRRKAGFLSQQELAAVVGESPQLLSYHKQKGWIPTPSKQIGKRRFFTLPQVKEIVRYFDIRRQRDRSWVTEIRQKCR